MHRLLEELARTTIDERVRAASKFHGHTQHDPTGTHRLEMSVSTWGGRTLSAFAKFRETAQRRQKLHMS